MPRYVILDHDHPTRHWDFLLEAGTVLRGWRLEVEPVVGSAILAVPMANHRLMYLDYEGPVSRDRGTVTRWDDGRFEWQRDDSEAVEVRLEGRRLHGVATISRTTTGWQWWLDQSPGAG